MELFHHYLTSTAETLGDKHLWSQGAVRLGFRHECVLELMLGMAAYHLASAAEQQPAMDYACEQGWLQKGENGQLQITETGFALD